MTDQYRPPAPDFTVPVELKCILDVDRTMRRMIPVAVGFGVVSGFLVALVLGLMFPDVAAISVVGWIVTAIVAGYLMYARKRAGLARTYRTQQRLPLSPQGLYKVDGTIAVTMEWSGIDRIEVRNSSLPGTHTKAGGLAGGAANAAIDAAHTVIAAGIVGRATIAPLPGASRKLLRVHDRVGGSNLAGGQPHHTEQGLIFPAEFEEHWTTGTVGAWLRHHRPDLPIPA